MSDYITISDLRRTNLRKVIEDHFDGIDRRLALALEVQPTQISRYFSETASKRNVSDDMARRIEQLVGLPEGWMDNASSLDPEEHIGLEFSDGDQVREYLAEYYSDVSKLSEESRQKVLQEVRESLSPAGKLEFARLLLADLEGEL